MHPSISTDRHDHDGGHARRDSFGCRHRYRCRAAAASWSCDHRWVDGQPDPHALHNAGRLSVHGPARVAACSAATSTLVRARRRTAGMKFTRCYILICAGLLLTACKVGPKYRTPSTAMTPIYKENPPDYFKEASVFKEAVPQDALLRGEWWQIFADPCLNELAQQV